MQVSAISKEMTDQLKTAINFATVIGDIKADEMLDRLKESEKVFEEITKKAQTMGEEATASLTGVALAAGKSMKSHQGLLGVLDKLTNKYPSLSSVGMAAFKGLTVGVSNLFAAGKMLVGILTTVIATLGRFSFAILSIPFRMFSAFVKMASEFSGDTAFLDAIENVRRQFGSLKEDIGKDVMGAFKNMRGELANTGLSVWRVFGNMAERLKYVTEVFEGLGPQAHKFGVEILKNSEAIGAFGRGLGIAEKDMKGIADRAAAFGTSLSEQLRLVANYSLQMGKAFGMSQKVIAKDMNEMVKDVKHFGSLTQKEMATATIFTRKLGMEVKNLLGLVDKFDTFEDAANSASQLNQAFGASIDAFQMMQEQDPAKRLDTLRQAMFAAGKSAEGMSRQELKLAAQTTGLDEAAVKLALSSKNVGVSYDKVRAESEKAEKAQLTQAQATKQLADSIERLNKQGNMLKGTFFDTFIHGFTLGVKNSRPFLDAIWAIRQALWQTLHAGREVGIMFVNTFPGIKDALEGISKLFRGDKFKALLSGIVGSFREFFTQLQTGSYAPGKLIENLRKGFFNFLDPNTPEGFKIINGAKEFLKAYLGVLGNFVRWGIEALTKGIKQITEFIRDPNTFMNALRTGTGPLKPGMALEIIKPLLDALLDKGLFKALGDALWDLLVAGYEKIKEKVKSPAFQKVWQPIWKTMLGVMFGPMVTRMAVAALIQLVQGVFSGGGLLSGITGALTKFGAMMSKATGGAGEGAASAAGSVTKIMPKETMLQGIRRLGRMKTGEIAKAGGILAAIGIMFIVGLPLLIKGLLWAGEDLKNMTKEQALKVVGGIVAIMHALLPLIAVVPLLGMATKLAGGWQNMFAGIGALLAGMVGMAIGVMALRVAFYGMDEKTGQVFAAGVKVMTDAMVAMTILIPILGVIGAIMIGTGGTAAIAAAAGLGALEVMMVAMSANIGGMMEQIKKMNLTDKDLISLSAFVGILQAVGEFTSSIVKVLDAVRPSFFELAREKSTASMENNIKQLNEFVKQLLGGLQVLVTQIKNAAVELSTPALQTGGRLLIDMLSAVADLTKSMLPIFEDSGLTNLLKFFKGKDLDNKYAQLGAFVDKIVYVLTNDTGLLPKIQAMVEKLVTLKPDEAGMRGVQAFTQVTSSIGTIMQAIIPSLDVMSKLGPTFGVKVGSAEVNLKEANDEAIANVGRLFGKILDALGPFMEKITTGTLEKVITATAKLNPDQLNKVSKVIPLFGAIGQILQGLGSAGMKGKTESATVNVEQTKTFVQSMSAEVPLIGTMMEQLSTGLGTTIDSVVKASDKITDPAKMIPRIKVMSKAFEMLGVAANSIKGFDNFDANMKGFADKVNNVITPNLDATLQAAVGVVASINALNEKLKEGDLATVTADVHLRKWAGRPELRDKKNYTVTNSGVTINATINVTMTASDVEDAILLREKSVIREHLLARPAVPNPPKTNPNLLPART